MFIHTCFHCRKIPSKGESFKVCSLCTSMHYCSVECQRKDWKAHKEVCKPQLCIAYNSLKESIRKIVNNMSEEVYADLVLWNRIDWIPVHKIDKDIITKKEGLHMRFEQVGVEMRRKYHYVRFVKDSLSLLTRIKKRKDDMDLIIQYNLAEGAKKLDETSRRKIATNYPISHALLNRVDSPITDENYIECCKYILSGSGYDPAEFIEKIASPYLKTGKEGTYACGELLIILS